MGSLCGGGDEVEPTHGISVLVKEAPERAPAPSSR